MSFFGGGSGKDKSSDPKNPPKGMVRDVRPIYHGNPQNMEPGAFRTMSSPEFVRPTLITNGLPPKKEKNSLMTRQY